MMFFSKLVLTTTIILIIIMMMMRRRLRNYSSYHQNIQDESNITGKIVYGTQYASKPIDIYIDKSVRGPHSLKATNTYTRWKNNCYSTSIAYCHGVFNRSGEWFYDKRHFINVDRCMHIVCNIKHPDFFGSVSLATRLAKIY